MARSAQAVTTDISSVSAAAVRTNIVACNALSAAYDLSRQGAQPTSAVGTFLAEGRAAWFVNIR